MKAVRIEVVHEPDKIPLVLKARFEQTFWDWDCSSPAFCSQRVPIC